MWRYSLLQPLPVSVAGNKETDTAREPTSIHGGEESSAASTTASTVPTALEVRTGAPSGYGTELVTPQRLLSPGGAPPAPSATTPTSVLVSM